MTVTHDGMRLGLSEERDRLARLQRSRAVDRSRLDLVEAEILECRLEIREIARWLQDHEGE